MQEAVSNSILTSLYKYSILTTFWEVQLYLLILLIKVGRVYNRSIHIKHKTTLTLL